MPLPQCLDLATDEARRPVLVWLHGGAFLFSAGSRPLFNGARLAARGDEVVPAEGTTWPRA